MTMQKDMMGRAVRDSFAKLDPRVQIQNPVMFLVWLSAVMTSVLVVASIFGVRDAGVPTYYVVAIAVILWLTDCSRTSPRRLPRAAVRLRLILCVRPRRMSRPIASSPLRTRSTSPSFPAPSSRAATW